MGRLNDKLFYDFNLHKLGYDFMGYTFDSKKELSYHHIKTKQQKGKTTYENGAILNRITSHNYIHVIEAYEYELFKEISEELKREHKDGITKEHLQTIRQILEYFECKYKDTQTKNGVLIVKEDFVRRRIQL